MKFSQSIVTRIVVLFTTLLICSILLTGYLVFRKSSEVINAYSRERIQHASELAQQSFNTLLLQVSNDVAIIANSPSLKTYIDQPSSEHVKQVESLFYTYLKNKDSYFQLRFIGVEEQGKEIIRMDHKGGSIYTSDSLQIKGDRDYYQEAIQMENGGIYFSRINLNEEFGQVSQPLIPTLRVATPIFGNSDNVLGLIVINVNLNQFYDHLRQIPGSESELFIIDASGQYLFAPDDVLQFEAQLDHQHNFYKEYSSDHFNTSKGSDFYVLEKLSDKNTYMSHVIELSYFNGSRKILLISLMQSDTILAAAQNVKNYSLRTILILGLVVIFVTLIFARYFALYLKQITKAIGNQELINPEGLELPVKRKDEIGILARAFVKMKHRIDQNMEKLNMALQKEKKKKNQRDEFLQNMSHELRTPLNAILGLTQVLNKNEKKPEQVPIIKSLERSAQSLSGLVYDVLDHQNLLKGKLKIEHHPVSIDQILNDIHATYRFECLQKGLEFELEMDKELKTIQYYTDSLRLSQIIINLLTNAIKYTTKGRILLKATVTGTTDKTLKIIVSDTGIGIRPENLKKINDRFFREDEALSGRNYGYGLGLSIVKHLSSLFNGTLDASSILGKGSVFIVQIPVIQAGEWVKEADKSHENVNFPILKSKKLILHIEDDRSTSDLIKFLLQNEQIELVQMSQLNEAHHFLTHHKPDLLISDLFLHSENIENQLIKWIEEKIVTCPLFLVTGLTSTKINSPDTHFIQKPFSIHCFKDHVIRVLGNASYSCPNFSNLYSNYDHNLEKMVQVLTLLETEFQIYLGRIKKTLQSRDQKEWQGIHHKIINHINHLDLIYLKKVLPKDVNDLNEQNLEEIKNTFNYYGSCIRSEKCIIELSTLTN